MPSRCTWPAVSRTPGGAGRLDDVRSMASRANGANTGASSETTKMKRIRNVEMTASL